MPGTRRLVLAVLSAAVALALGSPAAAGGDSDEGGRVARRWCTGCHIVDATTTTGADAAPPMPSLMKDPAMTSARLEAFLMKPHGGMEGMSFSRREIDDLVAYIADLAD